MVRTWFSFLILFALTSCKDTNNPVYNKVPYVYVYEEIYLNSIEAQQLNLRDGAYTYHKGGVKGIIVYRVNAGKYLAFERFSTATGQCQVRVDQSGFYILDTCTNTQFLWDGSTVRGVAPYPLKQYNVNKDNQRLIITN